MSKNNFNERLRKMQPKQNHYSIRKFTVGAASVLIGISFLGMTNGQSVEADVLSGQPETEVESKKDQQDSNDDAQRNNVSDKNADEQKENDNSAVQKQKVNNNESDKSIDSASGKKTSNLVDNKLENNLLNKDNLNIIHEKNNKKTDQKIAATKTGKAQHEKATMSSKIVSLKEEKNAVNDQYNIFNVDSLLPTNKSKMVDIIGVSLRQSSSDNYHYDDTRTMTNYHKTNDGSGQDPEIQTDVPTLKTITITDVTTGKAATYELQSDGSYNLISGDDTIVANGHFAPKHIDAGQIITGWVVPGNSDFGTDTSSSLAIDHPMDQQFDKATGVTYPNGKWSFKVTKLGSNFRTTFGLDLGWFTPNSTFCNYYGATATNTNASFKQDQDIDYLSQADFRKLVDVTDLGRGGWNGVNVDPDAPMTLAYVLGTDNNKKFWMTWAPDKEASTSTVADNVAGTVRIHFNDGTWLDVPVKIDVKNNNDGGHAGGDNGGGTPQPNSNSKPDHNGGQKSGNNGKPEPGDNTGKTSGKKTPKPGKGKDTGHKKPTKPGKGGNKGGHKKPTKPSKGGNKGGNRKPGNNGHPSNGKNPSSSARHSGSTKKNTQITNGPVKGQKGKFGPSHNGRHLTKVGKAPEGLGLTGRRSGNGSFTNRPETLNQTANGQGSRVANSQNNQVLNEQKANTLPQTGHKQQKQLLVSAIGLAAAGLAALLLYAGDRKRNS